MSINSSNDIAFSHNNKFIAIAGDDGIDIWDLETFELVHSYKDNCYSSTIVFMPDDKYVLSNCGVMNILWDFETEQIIQLGQELFGNTSRKVVSPNGRYSLDVDDDNQK